MRKELKIKKNGKQLRIALVAFGALINVLLFFIVRSLKVPFFFDTFGTIFVAGIAGLFPGIITAVITTCVCAFFESNSLFFMFINVILAIFSTWYFRANHKYKILRELVFVLVAGIVSGLLGAIIQLILFGNIQHPGVYELSNLFGGVLGIPLFASACFANVLVNIADKLLVAIPAFALIDHLPQDIVKQIGNSGWKQRPLEEDELKKISKWRKDVEFSASNRMAVTLVGTSLILVFIMGWIGISLYYDSEKYERTKTAISAAEFAADAVSTENLDNYLNYGEKADGYDKTEAFFKQIKNNSRGIEALYLVFIENNGFRYVFYVDSDGNADYQAGDFEPFDEAVLPYSNMLKNGEKIEPIISSNIFDWKMMALSPLLMDDGRVCYVVAEVSLKYMVDYMGNFILKVSIIMAGFFVLIVAYALWTTDVYSAYPIATMAEIMDGFSVETDTQEQMDENVRKIRALKIKTGDEVEKLYKSICRMTLSQADYLRSIRKLSESTAKMQDGLIITIADMVENRDSDMGAHIPRTTAYVKIISEGLLRKGYYPEKVNQKFVSDVVRSAPLYDVGKIKIPDKILNKKGKLNEKEFEVMMTHAEAGKEILENAISSVQGENYLKEARNMAAYHHERWDGTGYPEKIHGEVIPLSARIMAIADEFDALTSYRTYKEKMSFEEAVQIIKEESGTHFDPKCVEAFLDGIAEAKVIYRKYTS